MRAWQITKNGEPRDALALVDVPEPQAGEGMVRVAVDATGLGLPDVFMCRGNYAFKPELPFTPGQEIVGRVLESCAGGPAVGTRVMGVTAFFIGKGGYAESRLNTNSSAAFIDRSSRITRQPRQQSSSCIARHDAKLA